LIAQTFPSVQGLDINQTNKQSAEFSY